MLQAELGVHKHSHEAPATEHQLRCDREKRGQCAECGLQTHSVILFRRSSLTNEHVLNGRCLICRPIQSAPNSAPLADAVTPRNVGRGLAKNVARSLSLPDTPASSGDHVYRRSLTLPSTPASSRDHVNQPVQRSVPADTASKNAAKASSASLPAGGWLRRKNGGIEPRRTKLCGVAGTYVGKTDADDRPHGKGKMTWDANPIYDTYEGSWKHGRRDGYGFLKFANGGAYHGQWKDDVREGNGKIRYANGDFYEGAFKNGNKEGKGTLQYDNGDVYEGEWKNDIREGKGMYRFANGNVYRGEWKNGNKEGKGAYRYTSGNVYEGDFKNDIMEGKGTFKWSSGAVYDGQYRNDKPGGRGTYRFANGNVYEGEFRNGVTHGRGRMKYIDGSIYEGLWEDGKKKAR